MALRKATGVVDASEKIVRTGLELLVNLGVPRCSKSKIINKLP